MLAVTVNQLWDLRARGLTTAEIGAVIGWSPTAVKQHVREYGGVRPRRSDGRALRFEEREEILAGRAAGLSMREIGRRLGRAASTISRELARNTNEWGKYRATTAQARAFERARRPKPSKLVTNTRLREHVATELGLRRSPEQIVGRLHVLFPEDAEMRVSAETIYQAIYLQARGGLKHELTTAVRTGRTLRKPARAAQERRGRIPGMVMIQDRPAEADDRTVPGHWEGDLIIGKNGRSAIGTVIERHSNYLMLIHIPAGTNRVEAVRDGLIDKLGSLPDALRRSITWDQGSEMHKHHETAVGADIDVFFCDPHSPWQRASNENTNGLLRQYFPKGTDLTIHTPDDLAYVEWEMNTRPRKRLHFATPAEIIEPYLLH
ncbi:IS30 family transposase [Herbiconiux moechotypicola]